MRTYCQNWKIEDKEDLNILSQLVLLNLKKGEVFKISSEIFEVKTQTENTLRLKSEKRSVSFDMKTLSEYGIWWSNSQTRKSNPGGQLFRDIEGDLILDKLNSNNPFHKLTDVGKILLRDPIYN